MKSRSIKPNLKFEAGVSLVEFALVVPFLLLLLIGSLDLGWAVYANNTLANAAREGARKSIVTSTSTETIRDHVRSVSAGLDLPDENILIAPESRTPGDPVTVTVIFNYAPLTPLIGLFIPGGSLTLTGKATMYVE